MAIYFGRLIFLKQGQGDSNIPRKKTYGLCIYFDIYIYNYIHIYCMTYIVSLKVFQNQH